MTLLTVETFHCIAGLVFLFMAGRMVTDACHPRRWSSALFWALLGVTFAFGKLLPPAAVGYLVLAMVALAASGAVRRSPATERPKADRVADARRLGHRLFGPALLIPATAVAGSLFLGSVHWRDWWFMDGKQATVISLGLGAVLAQGMGLRITRAGAAVPVLEGGRLLQAIGPVLLLPQMLAALGGIFAQAGVGTVVADWVTRALPTELPWVAVAAYCFGMLLFTVCLGNAFAAFPVITLGIGLPFIVQQQGGNPAIMAAIGMLSGYCGTLLTPMAANFNLVPAMLLDLRDKQAVIKAQVPIALVVWTANVVLMYFCVYRF